MSDPARYEGPDPLLSRLSDFLKLFATRIVPVAPHIQDEAADLYQQLIARLEDEG